MTNLNYTSEHLEYQNLIQNYIGSINPIFHPNKGSRIDAIMNTLMGSRNIRLGPKPEIESQYFMRKLINNTMENEAPISILVPMGPKKSSNTAGIDLTELSMLNILNCLNNAIKEHYEPGLLITFRIEDLTGHVLEPDQIQTMENYMDQFQDLIYVLGYNQFMNPVRESDVIEKREFIKFAADYEKLFQIYLDVSNGLPESIWETSEEYQMLIDTGWSGLIPLEIRGMYMTKYEKLYPENTKEENITLMAKYFAAALARKKLDINKLILRERGSLEIAFMPPVPGYTHPIRFHYRSVDLKNTKRALPFWRAKGFLKIAESGKIRISNTTWKEAETMEFYEGQLVFERDGRVAIVQCDYILTD